MSIPIFETCRKKKKMPKLYEFHTFGERGCPMITTGPFRINIRQFINECAEMEDYLLQGMPISSTLLVGTGKLHFVLPLYTVEESVHNSPHPFCDHCRCTGWSRNLVSRRKYHFIIPESGSWNQPLDETALDSQSHLLHGLLHCNGHGHLISINGIESGSKFISGKDIMDLWDRICTILAARKVTVEDISKKKGVDLRLLHGIAYGTSWFGRWNYTFFRGNFGVSLHNYTKAVEVLSSLNLTTLPNLKHLILHYQNKTDTPLLTLRDLLKYMLSIKHFSKRPPPPTRKHHPCKKIRNFSTLVANMDSRWPSRRLEFAAQVIVEALKERRGGMTRQEVRDAARLHIGDTGLLDYVLKSMNNVLVRNHVVRRSVNPCNRVLEYTIHKLEEEEPNKKEEEEQKWVGMGNDVYEDISYICNKLLKHYPEQTMVGLAVRVLLDSKHFVKVWELRGEDDEMLEFIFRIRRGGMECEEEGMASEHVVVPIYASVKELKEAGEEAVRDTYCVMEGFVVTEVEGVGGMEDGDVIFGVVEWGEEVWGRGYGVDMESRLVYEGGRMESWVVRCECGAEEDDGERMVCCDVCDVWHHTRCVGVEDGEPVPPVFVCGVCCASLVVGSANQSVVLHSFGPGV